MQISVACRVRTCPDTNPSKLGNAAELAGQSSMLGRSAASNINYVRPVGGPKTHETKGNPNINAFV